MALKLSDLIGTLWSYLSSLRTSIGSRGDIPLRTKAIIGGCGIELRLLQRICTCMEMFFLKDSPSESEGNELDESLERFLYRLGVSITEKGQEIYSVIQQISKGELKWDENLASHCHQLREILRPLFKKAVEKYLHSSQCKHCTMEELLEFIQLVLDDAKEIHGSKLHYNSLEIMKLQKLEFLRNFIRFAASRGVGQEILQDLLAHVEAVATVAAFCSYVECATMVDGRTQYLIRSQYAELLDVQPHVRETYTRILEESRSSSSSDYTMTDDNIMGAFINSLQENHRELLGSNSTYIVSFMKIFVEELRFLRNFLIYKRQEGGDLDEEMANLFLDVVCEAGIVSYSLSWDSLKVDLSTETELRLCNWMEKVQLLKEDVTKKYPKTSRYRFPRTNELGFMDGLLEDLKELKRYNHDSIAFAEGQLDVVLEDLVFLRGFLQDMVKQRDEHEELEALWFRVVDAAYRFEFVTKSLVVGDPSPDCSPTSFNTIKDEIKNIKAEVQKNNTGRKFQIEPSNTAKVSNRLPPRSSSPTMDEVIVGLEDEAEKVIGRLEGDSEELDIVSIVGMPGQGKTTLAKKVYNEIRSYFHVCAWCCVSQGYQKKKLLLDILNDKRFEEMSVEDLEENLHRSLKGRRYLIVLDDIWDIEAWAGLRPCFPKDNNRSRILLTTRIHTVALQIKPDSNPHFLRLLNDTESMELLQKMLIKNPHFVEEGRPAEPGKVEMQIAESCKGLPLAVVTVAGVLATLEPEKWKDFPKLLSTALASGTDNNTELVELSYRHLPDYLKPCLLYFGLFLEDEKISVSKLIRLWVAEGLVQNQKSTDGKSLETVAEDYLIDLINRSLVMVTKQTSRGGIKACSVHDLVHQFCVVTASEENFFQQISLKKKTDSISEPRRLCIYSSTELQSFRHLSTLRVFDICHSRDLSIFRIFKLLRVLDLRGITCYLFPTEFEMLLHLRYLALVGLFKSIPSTIDKLWNLETFLLRVSAEVISLPYSLLTMTKLRHLHVYKPLLFSLPDQDLEKCDKPCNLETLSNLLLSWRQDMMKIIRKNPCLRKLKFTFVGFSETIEGFNFPQLNFLSQLESLKVHSGGKVRYQLENRFPLNLRKLTLSNFCLPWDLVSRFSRLPNLEVLKLLNGACEGETWDLEGEEFTKLRYLKFEDLGIVNWNACADNFPCLRQLVLHNCRKLQVIPTDFDEIPTLEILEVKYCHFAVVNWAQYLEEEKEGLKVLIQASPI